MRSSPFDCIDAELATEPLSDPSDEEMPDGRPNCLPAVDYDPNRGELTIHAPELSPHLEPVPSATAPPGIFPAHFRLVSEPDART